MPSKISLCMIVGNVEEYIERCLESFKPIADEIVVVRAIGSLAPDKTLEITANKFGAKTAEYKNKSGHEDWPHVDDFAAARQMSFDLASGDYLFWCDSDDVLESGADLIRQHADRGGYAGFIFPYKITGKGLDVPRERMVAKGSGKWRYPVHECFDFFIQPAQCAHDERVVVCHLPKVSKVGSNERNLKILLSIPESEMNAGLWYHLHAEHAGRGQKVEAVEAGKRALACKEIGRPEAYEIWLNLARLCEHNLEIRRQYLLQAYAADPNRREALGLLTCNALDAGKNEDAMAYARQMISTTQPAKTAWNSRNATYTWVGAEIYSQALRANNRFEDAEKLRLMALAEAGGPRISLIHATRGRPQKASQTRKLFYDLAEQPERVEHIFVFDEDDEESMPLKRMHHAIAPKGGGCVRAWNMGAARSMGEVIVQLSDDWVPEPHWDKLIMEAIGDTREPRVLAISDGVRNDKLLCMFICTRAYYNQDYFMFHPFFTGVYSDNYATDMAYNRGQVIEAKHIVFTHDHPVVTGKWDKTYIEQNAPHRYKEGEQVYRYLQKGDDWSTVPGWFNYMEFYECIANSLRDGDTIAEVGVWCGRSIIFLAQLLKRQGKRVKIYAVDTFKGEEGQVEHVPMVQKCGGSVKGEFLRNIERCGVAHMFTILDGDSAEMAKHVKNEELAFCYIDAAHEYIPVKRDLQAWAPKIAKFGKFAGHDAQWGPVIDAVNDVIGKGNYQVFGPCWCLTGKITFNDPKAQTVK